MNPSPLAPLIGTGMAMSRTGTYSDTGSVYQVGYYRRDGSIEVLGESDNAEDAVQQALTEHARRRR